MSVPSPRDEMVLNIPADLDAGSVTKVYTQLLAALDAVESSEAVGMVKLDTDGSDVRPLSLQLLVSAQQSFSRGRLAFGEHASAALAALGQSRKI